MANTIISYLPHLKEYARELRKNPTPAEKELWKYIRKKQVKGFEFHRQLPIDAFIVDFYCHELFLAIELDGPIHDYKIWEDAIRQARIESFGVRVIRFRNEEVFKQLPDVLARIEAEILKRIDS